MAFLFHIIMLNDENISILQLIKDCFVWIKLILKVIYSDLNEGCYMSKLSYQEVLSQIQYGLISSCQPVDDGPMDKPEIVSAMAQASVMGGASGLRIEGVDNLKATRPFVNVPIIGIVKRDLPDSPVRITPFYKILKI